MTSNIGNSYNCSLLVVDDDPSVLATLAMLGTKEFEVITGNSGEDACSIFEKRNIDLILADQKLPGMSGVQLLEWVRIHSPRTVRLLMTGLGIFEDAVDAINCGQVFRYIFKPWRNEELMEILRDAARTFILESKHRDLMEELQQLNQDLEKRVMQRTRELQESNHQLQQQNLMLQKLALTDPLTGLPNRRAMDRMARHEIRRRARYSGSLAIGVIDVDHFKEVNARFLLPGGDQVLMGLAKTLVGSLRTVDMVGRIGGEEFMLVAPETNLDGAVILGERIRAAVENSHYMYKNLPITITVSLGFAIAETGVPVEYEQIKHAASDALAEAKLKGRNRCVSRAIPSGGVVLEGNIPYPASEEMETTD
jgi:diguanylate cyclase (GGDEF)-like protein